VEKSREALREQTNCCLKKCGQRGYVCLQISGKKKGKVFHSFVFINPQEKVEKRKQNPRGQDWP